MSQIKRLGITKLILWSEAERFQTYPKALTRLEQGRTYTRQQIGEKLFALSYTSNLKPSQEHLLTNLFGLLQIGKDKLLLRGINLFQRMAPNGWQTRTGISLWESATDEWIPTVAAFQLGESYQQEPSSFRWQQLLAEQLARYEPRVRVLLYLLSHGHTLQFESPKYFGGNTQRTILTNVGKSYELFGQNWEAFNALLFDYADIAIGPWWREEILAAGFELADNFSIEGAVNGPPSTFKMTSPLKTALYVFKILKIFVEQNGEWFIDPLAFSQNLSPDLSQELIGSKYLNPNFSDVWQQLDYIVKTIADQQGFIIATEAVSHWGALTDLPMREWPTAFDALVRRGIFEGRVEVLDRHLGQPRMGRGLFDDENMRMVKLRVLI